MERHCVYCFDPTHPPFGDARTGWLGPAAQTCPGAAPAAAGQRAPLGSDSDTTAAARHGEAGRPHWARPGRRWPDTNARATRTTQREAQRAGWEEAAARATTSQAKTSLANGPASYHHAADVKASHVLRRRRDAPISNEGVVPSPPTATRSCARART